MELLNMGLTALEGGNPLGVPCPDYVCSEYNVVSRRCPPVVFTC